MKNIYFPVIIVFLATMVLGCNKIVDNRKYVPATPLITGKWYFKKLYNDYFIYNQFSNGDTVTNYTESDFMQLNPDGTATLSKNYPGLPKPPGFKYIYTPPDSTVMVYENFGTDSMHEATFALKALNAGTMHWYFSYTSTAIDFQSTETIDYYFSR